MAGYAEGMTVGDIALFEACSTHWAGCVADALSRGGRASVVDVDGRTPLHAMALGAGAWREKDGRRALCCSAIVKKLVEAGANIEALDENGNSALELAARSRQLTALGALIEAGAELRAALLSVAGLSSSFETVRMLVEAGADPLARDSRGRSPLELCGKPWGEVDQAAFAYLEAAEIKAQLASGDKARPAGAMRI